MDTTAVSRFLSAVAGLILLSRLIQRLQLSRAKHPSLRGHSRWSRRLARQLRYYEFTPEQYFTCDGAPAEIGERREAGMRRLAHSLGTNSGAASVFTSAISDAISDQNFTSNYRVPFPFRRHLPRTLRLASVATASDGVRLRDLDGNWRLDVSGSYGVNVFGYDFYKACIAEGATTAGELGPVLGPYHPVISDNVRRILQWSGMEQVSFHMSGTEAVMQAVRLARYHTERSHAVRLCGAYHGWWDGVQPGVGNQRNTNDVYTLSDMSERTLGVLNSRDDIACVLINPLQALSPNSDAPGDATLVNSKRQAHFDREAYTQWLQQLRQVCSRRGIVLIFDEVLTGFRLAPGGAQEYFGIRADMVTYGKTLGGGLPVGVVAGKASLMQRYREDQPANVCFARGTFNSHPYVMGAMDAFLKRIEEPLYQTLYREADSCWNTRAAQLNQALVESVLPVRVANMHSIFSVLYTAPCRYNWMFQFYLREQGLELSWVGSGRMIFSLNYSDEDFQIVLEKFVQAACKMAADGWWWSSEFLTEKAIQQQLLREMLLARFPWLKRPRTSDHGNDNITETAQ